jgi:alkylation response protein AidB-like acyl-CoA dehydrogenase
MFELEDSYLTIEKDVRRFMTKEVEPLIDDLEDEKILPYDLMKKFAKDFGLIDIGRNRINSLRNEGNKECAEDGIDLDPMMCAIIGKEIGRVYPSFAFTLIARLDMVGQTIMTMGTNAQKEKWGLPILTFEKIGSWCMTEPGSGSDAFALKTTAKPDGDCYILNGSKTLITDAPYADIFIVYAKIDRGTDKGKEEKVIYPFLVERGTEGFSTSTPFKKMGMKGSPTGAVYLDNVRIPKTNLLGETEETAREQAKNVFAGERSWAPAISWGIIERCLDSSLRYVTEREQWGKPIGKFQLMQEKLALMYIHQENVRNMVLKHATAQREGKRLTMRELSMGKLYATRAATECALEAIQIHGGYGYMREYRLEMLMRDAKLNQIGGGTDEIHIQTIAKDLLRKMGLKVRIGE